MRRRIRARCDARLRRPCVDRGDGAEARPVKASRRAEVTLTYLDDWVGLDIVDDGKGFSPRAVNEAASDRTSFGLIAMRQRVEQLGGTLTIESRAGAGTAIAVGFDLTGGPE